MNEEDLLRLKELEEEKKRRQAEKQAATATAAKTMSKEISQEVMPKINQSADYTPQQKEDMAIATTSEKQMKESIQRNESNQQGSNTKQQFLDALTFFGPQMIGGMMAAGSSGNDEFFVAGAEQAGKMRDSYLDYSLKRAKVENDQIIQPTKFQQSTEFMTKQGKPVVFNPNQGAYQDTKGNKVETSDIMSAKNYRQGINTELRKEGLSQTQVKMQESTIKNFTSKSDVKKLIDADVTTEPVINLLESNLKVTDNFLAPFIARGVQKEVGNLSETDLQNARVPLDIVNKMKSDIKGYLQGDMSEEEREATIRLLKFMHNKNKEQLRQRVINYGTKDRAARLSISQEEFVNSLASDVNVKLDKPKKKRRSIMSDAQRRRHEELKAKYRK